MNKHMTRIFLGLMALILVFGAIMVDAIVAPDSQAAPVADARRMTKKLAGFKQNCEDLGGQMQETGRIEETNGPFVTTTSISVKCNGGVSNGDTCTFTATTRDCKSGFYVPRRPSPTPPDTAAQSEADPAATPIITDLGVFDLPELIHPGLTTPTPTHAPKGPALRPTFEPVADPRD